MDSLGQILAGLFVIAILGIVSFIGFSIYIFYDKSGEQIYESKIIVQPEIKLETDGKKIDTIYVYKFK